MLPNGQVATIAAYLTAEGFTLSGGVYSRSTTVEAADGTKTLVEHYTPSGNGKSVLQYAYWNGTQPLGLDNQYAFSTFGAYYFKFRLADNSGDVFSQYVNCVYSAGKIKDSFGNVLYPIAISLVATDKITITPAGVITVHHVNGTTSAGGAISLYTLAGATPVLPALGFHMFTGTPTAQNPTGQLGTFTQVLS